MVEPEREAFDAVNVGGSQPVLRRDDRIAQGRRAPFVPVEVTGQELEEDVRQQLATLAGPVAGSVARHLVMVGELLDEDPELAYAHAQEARRMAGRVGIVREICGTTAYRIGNYQVALTELRAARRIDGDGDILPMLADCERALGRPEAGLELLSEAALQHMDFATRVEGLIVRSGILQELGRSDEALRTLAVAALRKSEPEGPVLRLRYAYAELLESLGQAPQAYEWFVKAAELDDDIETDAVERAAALAEGLTVGGASDE